VGLTDITFNPANISKSKIFIFEDQAFSLIAMENILFDQLKLRNHTQFFSTGSSIADAIERLFEEKYANQVALVLIDNQMPGMTGVELIKRT
jgi:CheY-like chemotaxis protein